MNDSRKFSFRSGSLFYTVCFHADRVEYISDELGLGVEKTNRTFAREELVRKLEERNGGRPIKWHHAYYPAGCVSLAGLTYLWLPAPWRNSAYLFLALLIWWIVASIDRVKKRDWWVVHRKDGSVAFGVQVSGWSNSTREDFRSSFEAFLTMPNQSTDPTHSSGTPAAGQPARPR
jgi:hypothetical protein